MRQSIRLFAGTYLICLYFKATSGHRMENPLRGQEREEVDCLRSSARDDALELGQQFRTAARSYIDEESWKRGEWNLLTDWICWRKTRRVRSGSCPIPAARVDPCAPTRPLQSRREQSCRLLCCLAEVEQLVSESFPSLGAAPFLICSVTGESRLLLPCWVVWGS